MIHFAPAVHDALGGDRLGAGLGGLMLDSVIDLIVAGGGLVGRGVGLERPQLVTHPSPLIITDALLVTHPSPLIITDALLVDTSPFDPVEMFIVTRTDRLVGRFGAGSAAFASDVALFRHSLVIVDEGSLIVTSLFVVDEGSLIVTSLFVVDEGSLIVTSLFVVTLGQR